MKLLIAGAGGHGRVVADTALATQAYSSLAFLDDRASKSVTMEGGQSWDRSTGSRSSTSDFRVFVAGLGDAALRIDLLRRARKAGFVVRRSFIRHATVSKHCSIDEGTVVIAGACINVGARIGEGCIINTGATVDHDCLLAEGVHICPGAHLAGNVEIGPRAWFGIGAVARQGIRIGADAVIGAGSVVIRDVPDNVTVAGNPARELEQREKSKDAAQGSARPVRERRRIPAFLAGFDPDERKAVDSVLAIGQGELLDWRARSRVRARIRPALGLRHSIALMNGSVALELALRTGYWTGRRGCGHSTLFHRFDELCCTAGRDAGIRRRRPRQWQPHRRHR